MKRKYPEPKQMDLFTHQFCSLLKDFRTENRLTQAELAKKLNVSTSQIPKWENGYSLPQKKAVLEKMAEIFGEENYKILTNAIEFQGSSKPSKSRIPNILNLLKITIAIMPKTLLRSSFLRCENRIREFGEDNEMLANNLILFLAGRLSLDDKPENGLRPLKHYIAPWNARMEEWESKEED